MAEQYKLVRIRLKDYEKMMREKKEPMEQDLREAFGKNIKIKDIQFFHIIANNTLDLGSNFAHKIIGAIKIKKKDLMKI